jgi:hypothetical protein
VSAPLLSTSIRGLHLGDREVLGTLGISHSLNCYAHNRPHNATEQLLTCFLCSLKVGRVVIITRGRYAGKKCVIISPLDNGTKSHPFPHALVAGVERYPSKVTRRMSKNKQAKKSKVKPFVKQVNCTWKSETVP